MHEHELLSTAQALALDHAAARVVAALGAQGIDALLLKGPVYARWLYADGAARPYDDIDVLVAPRTLARAYTVVERLGVQTIDLHDQLNGTGLRPARTWELLRARAVTVRVAGAAVLTLDPVARALHVALHAWWHGADAAKPLADLERALVLLPADDWRGAASLASELRALEGFAGGLALAPAGAELLGALGLTAPPPRARSLADADPGVRRLEELRLRRGVRARLHTLGRVLAPVPGEMRAHYPSARRGPAHLAAAYAGRTLRGAVALPAALRRWRTDQRTPSAGAVP